MVEWLVPICIFWVMAAVFFGGMYDAEEGSAGRQFLGLLIVFAVYVGIFAVLRLALGGFMGPVGRVILPAAVPTMFLGRLGKLIFGLLGVKITRVVFSADAH